MSTTNNQPATPDAERALQERIKQGKAGRLLTIEVTFDEITDDKGKPINTTRRYPLYNQTWVEVMTLRKVIYTAGFMYPISPDHWKVVHPMEIKSVDIWRQNDYFK